LFIDKFLLFKKIKMNLPWVFKIRFYIPERPRRSALKKNFKEEYFYYWIKQRPPGRATFIKFEEPSN